jgi:hypothetical protein
VCREPDPEGWGDVCLLNKETTAVFTLSDKISNYLAYFTLELLAYTPSNYNCFPWDLVPDDDEGELSRTPFYQQRARVHAEESWIDLRAEVRPERHHIFKRQGLEFRYARPLRFYDPKTGIPSEYFGALFDECLLKFDTADFNYSPLTVTAGGAALVSARRRCYGKAFGTAEVWWCTDDPRTATPGRIVTRQNHPSRLRDAAAERDIAWGYLEYLPRENRAELDDSRREDLGELLERPGIWTLASQLSFPADGLYTPEFGAARPGIEEELRKWLERCLYSKDLAIAPWTDPSVASSTQ